MEPLVNQFTPATMQRLQRQPAAQRDAVSALRDFVAAGNYAPGDRLPAERELIVDLGMSRSTLRKALDALERDGAIWRHVGKGTFVATGDAAKASASAIGLEMTPVRLVQARLCIEPSLAREAAIHASKQAISRITAAKDAARAATTWAEYEAQDDAFHRAIAEGSDNILLLALFDQLNQVRRAVAGDAVVRGSTKPPSEHSSFDEHDRIAAAIATRDPANAQQEMRRHIGSVSDRLFGEV